MNKKALRSIVFHPVVALAISAMSLMKPANAAVWQGGDVGAIDDTDNWQVYNITTTDMNFPKDGTYLVTQGVDVVIYKPWRGNNSSTSFTSANVTFDMGGHTLWATNGTTQNFAGSSYSTWIFTNGVFRSTNGTAQNAVTNSIVDTGAGVGMSIIASGPETTFIGSPTIQSHNSFKVINGAKAYGQDFYLCGSNKSTVNYMTNMISNAATVCFDSKCFIGTYSGNATQYAYGWHDCMTIVDNATLTSRSTEKGTLAVGYGQRSHDNMLVARNGAKISACEFYLGYGVATNNTFKAAGSGTEVSFHGSAAAIGGWANSHAASCNSFILEDEATATAGVLYVAGGGSGTNNTLSIRSGATMTAQAIGFGQINATIYGKRGRIEVVGEGSKLTQGNGNYFFNIDNHNGNTSDAHELLVGDGGCVDAYKLRFWGDGNKIILSNGTITVRTAFYANGTVLARVATNSVVHIEGSSSKMTIAASKDCDGTTGRLAGAPIFEFVIPEGGWSSAPVVINEAFEIGDDTTISIDKDSASTYARQGGGTVPLFSTGSSSLAITADLAKLSTGLPECCSLVNEGGVLSVKISKSGLILIVR